MGAYLVACGMRSISRQGSVAMSWASNVYMTGNNGRGGGGAVVVSRQVRLLDKFGGKARGTSQGGFREATSGRAPRRVGLNEIAACRDEVEELPHPGAVSRLHLFMVVRVGENTRSSPSR